jgi:NHL repeat
MGVASDGTHLFVADRLNNRVLMWNSFPTTMGQPADTVIGQPDFTTVPPNYGNGPFTFVLNGLNLPAGLTLDGTSLWIADTENNRLVRWDTVTTSPTPSAVVGQPSGTVVTNPNYELLTDVAVGYASNPPETTSSTSMLHPRAVALVGGRLYVSELDSNRVHIFDATLFTPYGELGQQADGAGTPNTDGVTAASLSAPQGLESDGTSLWVADSGNHRVLAWSIATPPTTGASASVVVGQPSLLTSGFNQSSTAIGGATASPEGLSFASGSLYIADSQNNRVLRLKTPVSPGETPSFIYGQPNGTLALPNSGGSPSAASLNTPDGVYADSNHVIIADTGNNRVLVYDASSANQSAALVLGQSSFASASPNTPEPSAGTMQGPQGVYSDGTALWVADTGNHRILVWKSFPTHSGQPADFVLGQASFSNVLSNRGAGSTNASSLALPSGIVIVNGVVYIADSGNNRVLFYSTAPTLSGAAADGVLGQDNLTSRSPAVAPDDLTHLAGPVAVATDEENLYVADRDLGRVVIYSVGTLKSASPATSTVGPSGGLTLIAPGGIAVERTALFTSRVFVSNSANNEVQVVDSVSRLVVP